MSQRLEKTYQELDQDSNKLMAGLIKMNVVKGDRVGIWSTSCYEWIVTQFAAAKLGAVLVNVNPGYKDAELRYCLNLVDCKVLIAQQKFKSQNFVDILDKAAPGLMKQQPNQLNCDEAPSLRNVVWVDQQEDIAPSRFERFSDILNQNTDCDDVINQERPLPEFEDVCNVQFTSGTTGRPKGAGGCCSAT